MVALARQIYEAQKQGLIDCIGHFGSQQVLADSLSVSRQVVNNWVRRGRVSATHAIKIEKITNGQIKKEDLRPDVLEWKDES